MDFEVINAATGGVSAICSLISLVYLKAEQHHLNDISVDRRSLSMHNLMAIMLATSGWAMICLCFLWIFEPFGCCPSSEDYRKFYAAILFLPSFFIFGMGMKLLREKK